MLRALYIADASHSKPAFFQFDPANYHFHCVEDDDMFYEYDIVMSDPDWIKFIVIDERVYQIGITNPTDLNAE